MNSNGDTIPVETHGATAKDIIKTQYKENPNGLNTYDFLFSKGWMRCTYMLTNFYLENNAMNPNPKQISKATSLAINNNMENIIFDNQERDYTLWSNSNKL
jgi:hypothetical protein